MSILEFPPPASPSPASSTRSLASSSSWMRLWRPAAQRNLRNQWSKLSTCRQQWIAACSSGRSHATSLVNSYLSQMYMPMMEFGVLSDMFDIKNKALKKLFKQQSSYRIKLLSSYKEMVSVAEKSYSNYLQSCELGDLSINKSVKKIQLAVVVEMVNASRSLRCYMKSSNGSLIQFSGSKEDGNDAGDCGGVAVFSFLSVSAFEKMAEELVDMFKREVMLKRLLIMELVSLSSEVPQPDKLSWSVELYNGEFDDLTKCSLYSMEVSEPILPRLKEDNLGISSIPHTNQPTTEILQIYLTTWLAEVNIDIRRVDEILALAGEEIRVAL